MNLTVQERQEIIRKLNFQIEQIAKIADGHLHLYLKDKLLTPCWSLSLDSVQETIKNYEEILNQLTNIQLKYVNSGALAVVDHDAIINHIADILIILSFIIEFDINEDIEC